MTALTRFGAPCQVAIRWTFAPTMPVTPDDLVRVELARVVNWRTDDAGFRWLKVALRPADVTKLWVPEIAVLPWSTPHPDLAKENWG